MTQVLEIIEANIMINVRFVFYRKENKTFNKIYIIYEVIRIKINGQIIISIFTFYPNFRG